MPAITPFLWFNQQLEQALDFYATVFPRLTVHETSHYGEELPGETGSLMSARFEIDGQSFMGLNGGPEFPFTEAISLFVACESQAEADDYWAKLLDAGAVPSQCGWIKDHFGLWWQIVPNGLFELLGDPDPAAAGRAAKAMLSQVKLDVDAIRRAAHPD